MASLALLVTATGAWSASSPTDFGIRTVGGAVAGEAQASGPAIGSASSRARVDLGSVSNLGSRWGRVTSTYRSPARNRRVGGVRNSYHLSGRAIDIARRPGVTHAQIAAAYRNAGYHLVESLDEGDHSHFAFGTAPRYARPARSSAQATASTGTKWRIVTAAAAALQ
ncbi:MAG TPA: D-Ala-D-Ala carboxypeptidase family metallohydrolase [Sphingomicrobium sp.]|nr:D-Ala-D-Ala carboxypeptidase family metallohydrolase [Sphingomicrobium sp.]